MITDKRLRIVRDLADTLTYHDPCCIGRCNGEIEAPRDLIGALGLERHEMERAGLCSFCCGGGGAPVTYIPGKARIPDLRVEQVRRIGADRVAVACPNCMQMLEGVVEPRPQIVDIAELLLEAAEP